MTIQTQNPATGQIIKTFTADTPAKVDEKIGLSVEAGRAVRAMSFEQRSEALLKAADILESEAEAFGRIMTLEMGKTLVAATAEAQKCALACRYYAKHGPKHLADDIVKTNARKAYRKYLPLGPVLAVMPWNYPFWQVVRFAAPALIAGNTCLLKHASNVPQCAIALEDVFRRAGFPENAFQTLLISSGAVESVLRDVRVRAATLTGSELAGSRVASICGEEIKPTVLELGGSDAFIVMPSADIDMAVKLGTKARTQNNGQSCIAAKRFIIHADVYDEFKRKIVAAFEALTIGDPMHSGTDIGPLVNESSRQILCEQVERAISAGGHLVTGARPLAGDGYYFSPGIIENVSRGSDIFYEEFFGPVALLFKVHSVEEAVELGNDSPFGLGGSIWSANTAEQNYAIDNLEAGATFVNSMTSSNPALPFGGIKTSGYGRELAAEGVRAFCNIKTVSIA